LAQGELAVNLADEALYTKDASNAVVKLNAPSIDDKNTGATKHVTIDTSGNVGIGTSSPDVGVHLRVFGNAAYTAQFGTGNKARLIADATGAAVEAVGAIPISFYTNSTERARIDSSGNLLVGATTGSGERIRANRSDNGILLRLQNDLTSGTTVDLSQIVIAQAGGTGFHYLKCYSSGGGVQQFAFRGDGQMLATSTSIASISDARTKENIRDAKDGLSVVLGLHTVRYDFKEGFGNNRKNQLGFIAQEVEQVFPDAVDVSGQESEDGDQYKTVAPGTLIPVLVKAMQEQQAIITALTARVEALEAK
jgi:hypothetical protein